VSHFKIVIPMYNVEKWVSTTIRSVLGQTYSDFEVIIIDDMSTDNSYEKVHHLCSTDDRFTLIRNKEKRLALENIVTGIKMLAPAEEDIIVTLDGDDWLANKDVLQIVNDTYERKNCAITYGTYITYPEGQRPWNVTEYSKDVVLNADYRKDVWRASHLRTFKYKLWNKIKKEDLLEPDGRYCDGAWDLAFMFPMLEMAGQRSAFIEEILYVYNRSNPLNEDKVDHQKQLASEAKIRNMKKYNLLEEI
jgi:glycosyltransferase involved in cell wall biosynthesis